MAIRDRYKETQGPWPAKAAGDPVRFGAAVTPSDTVDLPNGVCVAFYPGVTGDVAVTMADMDDGTNVVLKACAVGERPYQCKRIWATGTTATNIVALY